MTSRRAWLHDSHPRLDLPKFLCLIDFAMNVRVDVHKLTKEPADAEHFSLEANSHDDEAFRFLLCAIRG